jgi:hypothetical protein
VPQSIAKSKTKSRPPINALLESDRPLHSWYRFVLSYPPHLVRQYCERFELGSKSLVFDPFCGTGTTLVEAKKNGIPSVGCDAHPFAALVSRVKTNWNLDTSVLRRLMSRICQATDKLLAQNGLEQLSFETALIQETRPLGFLGLSDDEEKLLPAGFVSVRPMQRLLLLRKAIMVVTESFETAIREFFLLALGHVIANGAGNFAFGPEIYRTKPKEDYDVTGHYARQIMQMIEELDKMRNNGQANTPARVIECDSRTLAGVAQNLSAVITSPPYPNEKDYTRTTRVESLILGLMSDKKSLRHIKDSLLRSNTRNIFVDDRDREEVHHFQSIQRICSEIEERRLDLGKTSGFEKLYHKVVSHYFGGMRRHFRALYPKLRTGSQLAYVVGDQLSFLMVHIPTATLLGEVAESEGYEVTGCDLWRERVGTKIRNDLQGRKAIRIREEILLLKKV